MPAEHPAQRYRVLHMLQISPPAIGVISEQANQLRSLITGKVARKLANRQTVNAIRHFFDGTLHRWLPPESLRSIHWCSALRIRSSALYTEASVLSNIAATSLIFRPAP